MVGKTWLQEHEEDDLTVLIFKKKTGIKADVLQACLLPPFIPGGSSLFHYISLKMRSQSGPEVWLLEGPKSSQVDNKGQQSQYIAG